MILKTTLTCLIFFSDYGKLLRISSFKLISLVHIFSCIFETWSPSIVQIVLDLCSFCLLSAKITGIYTQTQLLYTSYLEPYIFNFKNIFKNWNNHNV